MKKLFVIGMYLSLAFAYKQAFASDYAYVPVENYVKPGYKSIILHEDENQISFGDVLYDAKFCVETAEYYCVASEQFSLAVPKNGLSEEWQYGLQKYEVIDRNFTLQFIGKKYEVYQVVVINIESDIVEYIFFYSRKYGVISIVDFDAKGNVGTGYFLIGKRGFAHR